MDTVQDIKRAIGQLSGADRTELALWIDALAHADCRVEEPAAAYGVEPEYTHLSVDEYLEFELKSPVRHEYIDGVVHAMSGASERHNVITVNLVSAFHAHLRGGPCRAYVNDFKVRLELSSRNFFYYPDVMVACHRDGVEELYLRYPKLVVEVLSPSTQSIDRREKFLNYRQIPTVAEYVLVSQGSAKVAIHRREEGWAPQWLTAADAVAEFRSIGLALPLLQIYEGLQM